MVRITSRRLGFVVLLFVASHGASGQTTKPHTSTKAAASKKPAAVQQPATVPVPPPEPAIFAEVRPLYKDGKYAEMQALLEAYLKEHADDAKGRSQLAIAMIHQTNTEGARTQLQILQASTGPDAKIYVPGLQRLLADEDGRLRSKNLFLVSVKRLRAQDAETAISQSPLTPVQKQTLSVVLMNYEGRFKDARDGMTSLRAISGVDAASLDSLAASIVAVEADTDKVRERLEVYLHSQYAPSYVSQNADWLNANPDFKKLSLQEYQDLVLKLNQLTPLNPEAMDLMFHATMLFSDELSTEKMGDKIIDAKEKIVVPCYSNNRFFSLVIDGSTKEIYTQDDPHPFQVANAVKYKQKKPEATDKHIAALVPFHLKLADIQELKQNGAVTLENMKNEDFALQFEPGNGTVPQYALMRMIYAFGGWKSEMQATRNLGDYIQHVARGQADIKAQLQEVKAPSTAGQTFGLVMMAAAGGMAAGMGNVAQAEQAMMLTQMMQTQMAQLAVIGNQQHEQVAMLKSSEVFNQEASSFAELEKLVGLVR